jgi:hypothetical protein
MCSAEMRLIGHMYIDDGGSVLKFMMLSGEPKLMRSFSGVL